MRKYFACVMKLHANVLKTSYFFYQIIDWITRFSFIIFSDFIYFMKYFILSTMDYHVLFFSLLAIIYCILWFACQSLYNKPVRSPGQKSNLFIYYYYYWFPWGTLVFLGVLDKTNFARYFLVMFCTFNVFYLREMLLF